MKILIISHEYPPIGGGERMLVIFYQESLQDQDIKSQLLLRNMKICRKRRLQMIT